MAKTPKRRRTETLTKFDDQTREFLTALRITIDLRQYYLGLPVSKDADKQCLVAAGRFYLAGKKPRLAMLEELKHTDPLFRAALSFAPILLNEQRYIAKKFAERRSKEHDSVGEPSVNGFDDSGTKSVTNAIDTAAA